MRAPINGQAKAVLESVGFEFCIMTGLKSRGPKPHRIAQVLPELHALEPTAFYENAHCVSKTLCIGGLGPINAIWS
jgi:hypothetical protein